MAEVLDLMRAEFGAVFAGRMVTPVRRFFWLLGVCPVLGVWLLVNRVCLALDGWWFPGFREVEIVRPVFVLGPPRSGTTHLHRVLAGDGAVFQWAAAWEVMLAPSVVQKKVFRWILEVDRRRGRPLVRGVRFVERKLLRGFAETHPGSVGDAEEDYFYLGSWLECSGWMLAFPNWRGFRGLVPGSAEGDTAGGVAARRRAVGRYRACLQRQVYVNGSGRTVLSKNASFSSWMGLLEEAFPDARFVVCMRDGAETVPSMLSTAEQAMAGFGARQRGGEMREVLTGSMGAHYRELWERVPGLGAGRVWVVENGELRERLGEVLRGMDAELGLGLSEGFRARMGGMERRSRAHRSGHAYSLEGFGLETEGVRASCPVLGSSLRGGA